MPSLALAIGSFLAMPSLAQPTAAYTTPDAFLDLFFDFSGSDEPGYPAGRPSARC